MRKKRNNKVKNTLWWLSCVLLILVSMASLAKEQENEFFLKAIFIEKFTQFIRWPERLDIENPSTPFVIKVIGENPFGTYLDNTYALQKILGKKVEIHYISKVEEIPGSHVLFISSSWGKKLPLILAFTRYKPILTIGDTAGFATKGVMVNFTYAEQKLRFEINVAAFKKALLYPSSMLLRSAQTIFNTYRPEKREKK